MYILIISHTPFWKLNTQKHSKMEVDLKNGQLVVDFKCYNCGKTFSKAHLDRHKGRKTPCLIRDVAPEDINNPNRCVWGFTWMPICAWCGETKWLRIGLNCIVNCILAISCDNLFFKTAFINSFFPNPSLSKCIVVGRFSFNLRAVAY